MSDVPPFEPSSLQQEQYTMVRLHYLLKKKKTPTRTYVTMKEVYGEQMLARSTIFLWYQQYKNGWDFVTPKLKNGRLVVVSTDVMVNTIVMRLADDDSISQ